MFWNRFLRNYSKTLTDTILPFSLFKKIDTGINPDVCLKSAFVPIDNKSCARKSSYFWLIRITSHALKIILKVIHQQIYIKFRHNLRNGQFRFPQFWEPKKFSFIWQCRFKNEEIRHSYLHLFPRVWKGFGSTKTSN